MKKNYTKLTILLSVAIIFLGYYIYKEYVSTLYLNNPTQTVEIDLAKENSISLIKNIEQKKIFALEIEIIGESATNLSILTQNKNGDGTNEIKLKKGSIDFFHQVDWYEDDCTLVFSAREKMKGMLKINYRFLGLN